MKLSLKIVLVAILSSIAVEVYGSKNKHKRREASHDTESSELENLGRNGPRGPYGPYGKRGHTHFYRRHYYRVSHDDLKRQRYYSEESSESEFGFNSDLDDSFDSYEYGDWYRPGRRPCRGWRCHTRDIAAPWPKRPASRKTTQVVPISETWKSISVSESSKRKQLSQEPVTTPTAIPALPVSPSAQIIMSRMAPIEEVTVTVTLANPEINPTTMSSPETSTISRATLDCIENCIATPEFHPVCGSNGETYENIGKLFCAKGCGIDVDLQRISTCSPRLPFPDDYNDYDNANNNNDNNDGGRLGNGDDEGNANDYDYGSIGGSRDDISDRSGESSLSPGSVPQTLVSDDPSPLQVIEQRSPPSGESLLAGAIPLSTPGVSSASNSEPSQTPGDKPPLLDSEILPTLSSDDGNEVVSTVSFPSSPTMSAPRFRRTTRLTDIQKCMKLCSLTSTYDPICGTDLVTYINIDRIECARGCGLEVQILCEQPCPVCNVESQSLSVTRLPTVTSSIAASSGTTPLAITTTEAVQTTDSGIVKRTGKRSSIVTEQCLKACPMSTEYNPICGTNNVNYTNPVHLLCAQTCGEDVKVARFGPCPPDTRLQTPTTTTTVRNEEPVTLSPAVKQCMRGCVVTSEYNPVCGTNEETYTNPGRLACAKYCGIEVELNYNGLCNGFFSSASKISNDRTGSLAAQGTASRSAMPTMLQSSISPTMFTFAPEVLNSIFTDSSIQKSTEEPGPNLDLRSGDADRERLDLVQNSDPNRIVFPN